MMNNIYSFNTKLKDILEVVDYTPKSRTPEGPIFYYNIDTNRWHCAKEYSIKGEFLLFPLRNFKDISFLHLINFEAALPRDILVLKIKESNKDKFFLDYIYDYLNNRRDLVESMIVKKDNEYIINKEDFLNIDIVNSPFIDQVASAIDKVVAEEIKSLERHSSVEEIFLEIEEIFNGCKFNIPLYKILTKDEEIGTNSEILEEIIMDFDKGKISKTLFKPKLKNRYTLNENNILFKRDMGLFKGEILQIKADDVNICHTNRYMQFRSIDSENSELICNVIRFYFWCTGERLFKNKFDIGIAEVNTHEKFLNLTIPFYLDDYKKIYDLIKRLNKVIKL